MTAAMIEALVTLIETAVPEIITEVQSGGMSPDTAQAYIQRINTAIANIPKPGT